MSPLISPQQLSHPHHAHRNTPDATAQDRNQHQAVTCGLCHVYATCYSPEVQSDTLMEPLKVVRRATRQAAYWSVGYCFDILGAKTLLRLCCFEQEWQGKKAGGRGGWKWALEDMDL